jgi:fructose-bisphosphate aldolase, class II
MHGLRHVLDQAQKNGVAVGHFNVADLVLLKAIFAATGTEGPGHGGCVRR